MGTQTLSKSPTQFVQGVTPIYLQRGKGSHVWDVDGNEYVDYPMALGPVLLGYAEPVVDDARVHARAVGVGHAIAVALVRAAVAREGARRGRGAIPGCGRRRRGWR